MFTNCYKLRFRRVTAIESPFQCFLHIKMPGRCSAPRCTNSNKEGFCLTTFTQDPKLRQEWIDAAGIPDWNPPKSAVLCEVHFRPSALYCVGNKKFIKKNIIPSFFCKCDGSIKRKPLAEIQSRLLLLGKSLNNKFISHFNTALKHLPLSTCHDIKQKLISRFVSMRLKQLSVPLSITEDSEKISSAFASKTMGAGLLADRFKQKKYARRY